MTTAAIEDPTPHPPRRTRPATAEGTSSAPFGLTDWGLVAFCAVVWGSSFLLIAEGLETFGPGVVALGRLLFGCASLLWLPRTRSVRIDRADWPRLALLSVVWFALPQTLFPIAEQWIASAVAGMLNGAMPLFTAVLAAILLRRPPGRNQIGGLIVGFVGVVLISIPSIQGGSRMALGVVLVVVAMASYAIAANVVVPLQQRYGALPIIARAQLGAVVLTVPYGVVGATQSTWSLRSFGAVLALGAVGTGVAFVVAGNLIGRVGATRASVIAYLIPVVALVLGLLLRGEDVAGLAIAGLGLVLVGAWLTSRAGR